MKECHELIEMSSVMYALVSIRPVSCYLKGDLDVAFVASVDNVIVQKLAQ
jgi:hypothetical protein